MPVGNSDRGVGLWAGQIMFGLDNSNEYIDWWHDVLPDSSENFEHKGIMASSVFTPSVTIGLSNYFNISLSQIVGYRHMFWTRNEYSIHHRTEGSAKSFMNAVGGLLGDRKVMVRYLAVNTGQGTGARIFVGGGAVFPSKNTLTSDPYFLNSGGQVEEHRHFSVSDGCYKVIGEMQFYFKRSSDPVFIGGAFLARTPIKENRYGYKSPKTYDLSLTATTKEKPSIKGSFNFNLGLLHTTHGFWNGFKEPNSQATLANFGLGLLKSTNAGVVSLSVLKPFFISGGYSGTDSEVDSKINAWRLNFGFRRLFDYTIPWLDPFKNL
tara:strand:+ start:3770 stop:4735 length:966 start_codon:yes stop_codon:yes gene_type:complete